MATKRRVSRRRAYVPARFPRRLLIATTHERQPSDITGAGVAEYCVQRAAGLGCEKADLVYKRPSSL